MAGGSPTGGDATPDAKGMGLLPGYAFDPAAVARQLRERGARRVILQMPEGLRHKHADVAEAVERESGATVLYASEPSYGACDLSEDLGTVRADLVLHLGHTEIPGDHGVPALLVPLRSTLDVRKAVEAAVPLLTSPVGLTTNAQHLDHLDSVRALLEGRGLRVLTAVGGRGCVSGQLLGCNVGAARAIQGEAASYLYVGTGNFHPLGVALATRKRVIVADPSEGTAHDIDSVVERLLRQRHAVITKAADARRWGVVLGTKTGQRRPGLAYRLVDLLREHGREARLITMATSRPELLMAFPEQAYVSTSCPRIAIDDADRYDRPMLTPPELEILLGLRRWEDYEFDEFA